MCHSRKTCELSGSRHRTNAVVDFLATRFQIPKSTSYFAAAAVWLSCAGAPVIGGCDPHPKNNIDYITITPPVRTPAAFQRGSDILLQARGTYSQIREYEGTVELSGEVRWGATKSSEQRRPGVVSFSAPDKLKFEYFDSNRLKNVISGSGNEYLYVSPGSNVERYPSAHEPLELAIGVSLEMSGWIPSILCEVHFEGSGIDFPEGDILSAFATKARLDGDEEVDGALCHRVVCDRQTGLWTLWVDADQKLLRRIRSYSSPAHMAFRESIGKGSRSGRITSIELTQHVRWSQVEFGPPRFQELPKGSANSDASH